MSEKIKVLLSEEEVDARIQQVAAKISKDYAGKNLLLVSILKGSVVFMADLMRAVKMPCAIDFMVVSSYGGANTSSTGLVKIIKDSGNAKYADTIVCGFDGNTSAISAIKDGALGMDVAQLGYDLGYKAVEAAVKALEGEKIDSFIDSGAKIVDSANCDEYIDDMKSKGLWE